MYWDYMEVISREYWDANKSKKSIGKVIVT